jgi:hypothetical protein
MILILLRKACLSFLLSEELWRLCTQKLLPGVQRHLSLPMCNAEGFRMALKHICNKDGI